MTMFRTTLVVALMAYASGAVAQTGDWRYLGPDGPVEVAVDVSSFSGPQERRTSRMAIVSRQADGRPYSYLLINVVFDCAAHTISGVSIGAYDARGSMLGDEQPLSAEITPVKEEDGTAANARAACEGDEVDGARYESAAAFADWVIRRRTP